jgi:hypothetical protein
MSDELQSLAARRHRLIASRRAPLNLVKDASPCAARNHAAIPRATAAPGTSYTIKLPSPVVPLRAERVEFAEKEALAAVENVRRHARCSWLALRRAEEARRIGRRGARAIVRM